MPHINITATQNSVEIETDGNDWGSFEINGKSFSGAFKESFDAPVDFWGHFKGSPGSVTVYPLACATCTPMPEFWLAVITFENRPPILPGMCKISGTVMYGNPTTEILIAPSLCKLTPPFNLDVQAQPSEQGFSANQLTGVFSVKSEIP